RATALRVTLEESGFFYGQSQYYVVAPPLINVYYPLDGNTDEEPSGQKVRRQRYHHEIFALRKGKWLKAWRNMSDKPTGYVGEPGRDTSSQSSLSLGELAGVFACAGKAKSIDNRGKYALVIYSDTPERAEFYALKTALLVADSGHWLLADTHYSGDAENF